MLKIAIVGCGQVGSRHLQSLAQLEEAAQIYLVDPSEQAREIAKDRFYSVLQGDANERFILHERDLSELDESLDVAIMASGSKERAKLTTELIGNTTPSYIVFEKFLFQELDDYDEVRALLSSGHIKAWVNQWFSSAYAFRRIASWLGSGGPISMEVTGNEWGLACNTVHFVELFDYLNGRGELVAAGSELNNSMIESKRQGYFEVNGRVIIKSENSATLEMVSQTHSSDGLIHIKMTRGDRVAQATLDAYSLNCEYTDGRENGCQRYIVPMQSNMTSGIIQRLMLWGQCQLPDYNRSAIQHKLLIDIFYAHFRQNCGWKGKGCPIT